MPGVKNSSDLYRAWMRITAERCGVPGVPNETLYEAHNLWVRAHVPPERLLIFDPSMGWEPLCTFLGKDLPHQTKLAPFPKTNERARLRFYKQMAMICGVVTWGLIAVLLWQVVMIIS